MDEIAKRRAEKMQDSREWSALDALEDLVALVKSGECKPKQMVIHFFEDAEDGRRRHHYQVSGVTFQDHIALLNVALTCVINDWME